MQHIANNVEVSYPTVAAIVNGLEGKVWRFNDQMEEEGKVNLNTKDRLVAEGQAQVNADFANKTRWLFMHHGSFWLSKTAVRDGKRFDPSSDEVDVVVVEVAAVVRRFLDDAGYRFSEEVASQVASYAREVVRSSMEMENGIS